MSKYIFIIAGFVSVLLLSYYMDNKNEVKPKIESKKLYFEFRTKDSAITADGFLRYNGKWCPIVLNDSMAIIYKNNQ